MIELDPSDRRQLSHRSSIPISMLLLGLLAIVAGGLYFWYNFAQRSNYTDLYKQLGIPSLPLALESQPTIQRLLDQLKREPCYRDAIIGLADALLAAGYPRDADTSLLRFSDHCGGSDELLLIRYKALSRASDFPAALFIIDELVKSDPADPQLRYSRGATYEKLKKFDDALSDYINSVQLLGDPRTVSAKNFYDISRMYAALGRYCDAITPMETYTSFDPSNRQTTQTTTLVSEFANKGKCDSRYAIGTARVSRLALPGMAGVNTLVVTINGVSGNFLLDTGATYVSVTSDFASKSKLNIESGTQLPMKTVGGTALADLGYAAKVSVGKAEAQGVSVVVIRGASDPFGGRLEGLLGMSFLSRFKVNLASDAIELSAIPLR